jgi:hypothetical protein
MTTRTKKTARTAGGEKQNSLKAEATKAVKKNANAFTNCLVTCVKQSDAKSLRLLMELAEGDEGVKQPVKEQPIQSLAARLAAEPQWPIDLPEEDWDEDVDAETEVEGRETVTA